MREIYLKCLRPATPAEDGGDWGLSLTHFPCVVGRHPECAARIDNPLISRRHCSFFLKDDQIWVEDLGSRNGTTLNGQWLASAKPVQESDRLELAGLPFQVRLPTSPQAPVLVPEAAINAAIEEPEPTSQPHHVLVVEDNAGAAATLALVLTHWGHDVQVAHDGPAALRAVREQPPDTVLLDLCLPGMDGYQVAEQLRAQPDLGNARLVAMTGYEAEDFLRPPETSFDHHLTKPVDLKVLQEVISPPA
jgi:CheY-like chemotaxis protein